MPQLSSLLQLRYQFAALRVQRAFLLTSIANFKAGFRQDQSRNPKGEWDGRDGKFIVTRKDKTGNPKIDYNTDTIIDVLREVDRSMGPGSGPAYGVRVHMAMATAMRALDLPGIGSFGIEQSFSGGDTVRYGLDGSVRTDIVLRNGRTSDGPIMAVWDIKTGGARLTPARVTEIRASLGIGDDIPIIEIHIDRGVAVKHISCSVDLWL